VLVTGGSSGLGAAVVHAVVEQGRPVVVLDRRPPQGDVPWVEVDLADARAAERATGQAMAEASALGGPITAVVTAAGIDACGGLDEVDPDAWDRVVAVNLIGTAAVVRAALPSLRAHRGRVVTVASTLGLRALPQATAYCASKFGVVGFTRALAAELAGHVGVTLLVPGGMATPFFDDRPAQYRPGPDASLNKPEAVAAAVVMALSQPEGCELREVVITPSVEPSWP
jgi:NAD(P)-dependent dehydrogenase (short-subunit alcohol dehydrogenase family)